MIGDEVNWRKNFKILSIPMNPLSNEGLLALMSAGTAGAFKYLEVYSFLFFYFKFFILFLFFIE